MRKRVLSNLLLALVIFVSLPPVSCRIDRATEENNLAKLRATEEILTQQLKQLDCQLFTVVAGVAAASRDSGEDKNAVVSRIRAGVLELDREPTLLQQIEDLVDLVYVSKATPGQAMDKVQSFCTENDGSIEELLNEDPEGLCQSLAHLSLMASSMKEQRYKKTKVQKYFAKGLKRKLHRRLTDKVIDFSFQSEYSAEDTAEQIRQRCLARRFINDSRKDTQLEAKIALPHPRPASI